jgi:hypothetical protein
MSAPRGPNQEKLIDYCFAVDAFRAMSQAGADLILSPIASLDDAYYGEFLAHLRDVEEGRADAGITAESIWLDDIDRRYGLRRHCESN